MKIKLVIIGVMALFLSSCGLFLDGKASEKVFNSCFGALEDITNEIGVEVNSLSLSELEFVMQSCLEDEDYWGDLVQSCKTRQSDGDMYCQTKYNNSTIKGLNNLSEKLREKYGASN